MSTPAHVTKFLNDVKQGALNSWSKYKILPSVLAAQGILESGWGRSELATKANNLFGIKSSTTWKGAVYSVPTNEYVNGKKVEVTATFRKYSSWSDSIVDHGEFLTSNTRYKKAVGEKDYKKCITEIKNAGYATDPSYITKIVQLIEQYKLNEWDNEAFKVTNSNNVAATNTSFIVTTGTYKTEAEAKKAAQKIKDAGISANAFVVKNI